MGQAKGESVPEEKRHRCFIGAPVPADLVAPLSELRDRVLGGEPARPVPVANLHMTLVFIGGLETTRLHRLMKTLQDATPPPTPGDQHLTRAGGFPAQESRLVAVEGEVQPALAALHAGLLARLAGAGVAATDRRLRPHVTLAKKRRGKQALADVTCDLRLPIRELVLYESVPTDDGGVAYRPKVRMGLS